MKKIWVLLIALVTICKVYAQTSRLLIDENFTDYTTGSLNTTYWGQGYWQAAFINHSSDFIQVANSAPLMYPDYTSGTNYINVIQKDDYFDGSWKYPDDPYKPFKGGELTINYGNTTVYISFLVRVPSAAGVASTGNAKPNLSIRTLNGSQFANFYIGTDENGSQLKFGINKAADENGTFAPTVYNFNTTYLVVLRYDIANSEASPDYDDKMYMWVNPSLAAEPAISTAQVAIDNFWDFNFDGGFNTLAQSLQLFQEPNSATASFDAFKVAEGQGFTTDDANSAAAWDALSPAGVPLALAVDDHLEGYVKERTVQLEWNVDMEISLQQYEIERSTDGVSFTTVGTKEAQNNGKPSFYTWTDATPVVGNSYYRIKNIFIAGHPTYSTVIKIVLGEEKPPLFSIYPNPVADSRLFFRADSPEKGSYVIRIFNSGGQCVFIKQFTHAGGIINEQLIFPASLQRGIYSIQLKGKVCKEVKQFLVQ